MRGLSLRALLTAAVIAVPAAAANSAMTMDCEGFGRVARFVYDNGTITREDFKGGKKLGGPYRMNLVAFDEIELRAVASREDEFGDISEGLLTVFELDFAELFARETRFNTLFEFRTHAGWVYDRCRRLD